jgi:hypothetical protein
MVYYVEIHKCCENNTDSFIRLLYSSLLGPDRYFLQFPKMYQVLNWRYNIFCFSHF